MPTRKITKKTKAQMQKLDAEARKLLRDPKFLFNAGQKLKALGLVGEEDNAMRLIVCCMGMTLPEPGSIMLKGPSSCGKSTVIKTVLRLFPPNRIIERSGLSGKALAYGKESLASKLLFIAEYRCGKDSQQLLRLIQSEGQIKHEATTVRGARRVTKTMERNGTPVVLTTTTDEEVFHDDETRFLSQWADASPEQSRAILISRAKTPRVPQCTDLPVWQQAMSLLRYKPGDFDHPPKFLAYVARKLPLDQPRVRRDWERVLSFSSAVALWRSFESEKAIDIDVCDYCITYRLLEPVLASTLSRQKSQEYLLAKAVLKLHSAQKRSVTVKEVAQHLGWREAKAYKRIKQAVRKKLVKYEGGTRQKNVKLLLPAGGGGNRFLPSPRSVLKHHPELGEEIRYVDPFSGEIKVVRP